MESSIPGIRPGKATTDYLQKTLNRLTFLGALFLAFIAIIPTIIETMINNRQTILFCSYRSLS